MIGLATLVGVGAVAPAAHADGQRYLCDVVSMTTDGHGIGTGNCVSAGGGAPAMGAITGAFDIAQRSDNYTVHCYDNGGGATGEAWLPGEVNGFGTHCAPTS
ncbi:hypothetical protein [Nocardia niigatensis]